MRLSRKAMTCLATNPLLAWSCRGTRYGQMGLFVRDENEKLFFFVADAAWLKQSIVENRPPHKIANLLIS